MVVVTAFVDVSVATVVVAVVLAISERQSGMHAG